MTGLLTINIQSKYLDEVFFKFAKLNKLCGK